MRDSVRIRRDSLWGRGYGDVDGEGWCLGAFGGELLTMTLVGDGGTGGRSGTGRRLTLGVISNVARVADGGGAKLNDVFHIGADGGGRDVVLRL